MGQVLIVDDDMVIRSMLRTFLESRGVEVHEATDGRAVFDLLASGTQIDVILLDLELPGMSGEEVMTVMEADAIQTPIVVMTGYCERAEPLAHHGHRVVLRKPMALDRVYESIRQWVEKGETT